MRWGPAAAAAVLVVCAALAVWPVEPSGAPWDSEDPKGHSRFAESLAREGTVRVVEGSLSVIPPEAGKGDVLFAFLLSRNPTDGEIDRVERFVRGGGMLVLASDGVGGGQLLAALGISLHGIPALRLAGEGCVMVHVPVGSGVEACLPSPSAFPDASLDSLAVDLRFVARSQDQLVFDLDGDGRLSIHDQGPGFLPLVLSWPHGEGEVVAIADSDLWRNSVLLEAPFNTDLARGLAADAGTVYLDGTGGQDTQAGRLEAEWMRVLGESGVHTWPVLLLVMAVPTAAMIMPRLASWRPHEVMEGDADPRLRALAERMLRAAMRAPRSGGLASKQSISEKH